MSVYSPPGVRFEWLDPPRAVAARRTDVAGFAGIAERGPLHVATRVDGWTQFITAFGGHCPESFLAYAVEGFFENGGETCWVVRVAEPETALAATLDLEDARGSAVLRLTATSEGTWAHRVLVTLARTAPDRFALTIQPAAGAPELWRDLTMDMHDPRYVTALINDEAAGSSLVRAEDLSIPAAFPESTPSDRATGLRDGVAALRGGAAGLAALRPEHFTGAEAPPGKTWGLAALETADEVAIVALPDAMPKAMPVARTAPRRPPRCATPAAEPLPAQPEEAALELPPAFDPLQLSVVQEELVRHCERLADRVAVLDPPPEAVTPAAVRAWRRDLPPSSYAAVYWPWLRRPDPLQIDGLLRAVPPSGHVAGIYARGDRRTGPHQPPANEPLRGVNDVVAPCDDVVHGTLNAEAINVIRPWNASGIRVAGARTLSEESGLRFVNVRRLLTMIEEAILEDTQWAVFEPNGPDLWREVDRVLRGFLDRLWRAGMLDGAAAGDAYEVTCDATTTTPQQAEQGRLVCVVGIQPPWPAEYVVVRIGRTEAATEIVETSGAIGGG
jgi:uncharacterized protein